MKTVFLLAAVVAAVVAHPHFNAEPEVETFFDPIADTIFTLYTRDNPTEPQILNIHDDNSLAESNFNPNNPTRITIHGWNGNAESNVNTMVREAYFENGDFNVIVVDWSVGADTTLLVTARNRVAPVGGTVAMLITMLTRSGFDIGNLYIIGHNLGAHVAGFAGKNYIGEERIAAIVALDASLSNFSNDRPEERLAVGDAVYVESIHTNAGQQGFDWPLGDASFYPNFGNRQGGCGVDVTGNCAHNRAIELFAESINTQIHFWSRQCSAYKDILVEQCTAAGIDRKMGGQPVDTLARGIYWLTTNNASPFATGIV